MNTFLVIMGSTFCVLIMLGVIMYVSAVVKTFIDNVRDYRYYKIRCECQERDIQDLKAEIYKLQSQNR